MYINGELSNLLKNRWDSLPEHLRTDNQVVGRHWVQCGFTMGPAQCSFGCSHCYLPANANRTRFPALHEMKEQIDRNREMTGPGGNIQITGGDLVDAYLDRGKGDELVEIIAYAVERELVPMLMTHGQGLMEKPDFLLDLVRNGGLRKLSCHIDITQGGRAGYPKRSLVSEKQLNPVRDRLVKLILEMRERSGMHITAAQTITVSSINIESIQDVIEWVVSSPSNLDVTRTLSFQTEAMVGRTQPQENTVSPERTWEIVCDSFGLPLSGDQLLFGHPDCTSKATVLVRSADRKVIDLAPKGEVSTEFWRRLLDIYSGRHIRVGGSVRSMAQRTLIALANPRFLWAGVRWINDLFRNRGMTPGMLISCLNGSSRGLNIVMHNFMDAEEVLNPDNEVVRERLAACSFRGALKMGSDWVPVPMCQVNSLYRPNLYRSMEEPVPDEPGSLGQSISVSTPKPPRSSGEIKPSAAA